MQSHTPRTSTHMLQGKCRRHAYRCCERGWKFASQPNNSPFSPSLRMPKSSRSSSHFGAVVATTLYHIMGKSLVRGSKWSNGGNTLKRLFVTNVQYPIPALSSPYHILLNPNTLPVCRNIHIRITLYDSERECGLLDEFLMKRLDLTTFIPSLTAVRVGPLCLPNPPSNIHREV